MYLVNPRTEVVHGERAHRTLAGLPGPVDLAYVMVPTGVVLDVLREGADAGVRAFVILTAGFGETGPEGARREAEIVAFARERGLTVLGPNGNGYINAAAGITPYGLPIPLPLLRGPVGVVLQSGGLASAVLSFAQARNLGISLLVSMGNESLLSVTDLVDYLVDDPATQVIALFLESIRQPAEFAAVARRALAAGKPIVALKVGRSVTAQHTAQAHTGALTGDDAVIDSVFRRLGVARVRSLEDLIITAGVLAELTRDGRAAQRRAAAREPAGRGHPVRRRVRDHRRPGRRRGPGPAAVRARYHGRAQGHAARVRRRGQPARRHRLRRGGPDAAGPGAGDRGRRPRPGRGAAAGRPGAGRTGRPGPVPGRARGQRAPDRRFPAAGGGGQQRADRHHPGRPPDAGRGRVPAGGGRHRARADRHRRRRPVVPGLPCGGAPARLRTGRYQRDRGPWIEAPEIEVTGIEPGGIWAEDRAAGLLGRCGVPVVPHRPAGDEAAAVAAAAELGYPVVVKAGGLAHKSDTGGVRLNLGDEAAVRAAYRAVAAVADGGPVLVQPYRTGGVELITGIVRDPAWGLMLAVGLGGIWVEVLRDAALLPLPVSPGEVIGALRELRGLPVLRGARGTPPADLARVAEVIADIAAVAVSLGDRLESLEVNPLLVRGDQVEALDALITWRSP